jgi:iduronate 2-sulfatase
LLPVKAPLMTRPRTFRLDLAVIRAAAWCLGVGFVACIVEGNLAATETAVARPNVLMIAIDDLRPALGCYGDPLAKSPHIDRFATTARLFQRAYCHQAVCGPSRASLLTGKLPENIGVWHNRNHFRTTHPQLVTLPQLFKNHGYDARCLGKIFSGDRREEDPASWSVPAILKGEGWNNYAEAKVGEGKGLSHEAGAVADHAYADGKLADLAIATLEQLKTQSSPFFLAVGFFKPHLPFNAPQAYWDLHQPQAFALPASLPRLAERVVDAPPEAYHTHRELGGYRDMPADEQLDRQQTQRLRHAYYACVSYTDAQVGRVLEALTAAQLDKHTIVVIWGDHGYGLGEMQRWCKGTNFELDTRVPLLVRAPGLAQPGLGTHAIVEYVDLYPTLAQLAGLTPPEGLDGQSFHRLLADPQASGKELAFSQFARPFSPDLPEVMGYSIRTASHRYTRWVAFPERRLVAEELYDYEDPASVLSFQGYQLEHANIVARQPARHQQLSRMLDELLAARLTPPAMKAETAPPKKRKKKAKAN